MQEAGPVKFSIVIPLHNKARYIRCTLDSVLAQTFTDFEVIVVDDGSTDAGARIVAASGDRRVRLVRQGNAGVSVARNRGIEMARGEWIAFLDADDWQHPDFLAGLVATQQAHPAVDAVATRFVTFTDDAGLPPPPWRIPDGPLQVELLTDLPTRWLKGPTLFTSSIAVRARLLQQLQPCFHPGESWGEDLDLWFRVAERSPIALNVAPLAAYRKQVAGSLTSVDADIALPQFVHRMRERALSGQLTHAQSRSVFSYIAQIKVDLARNAMMAGRRVESLAWLLRGVRAAPSRRWWLTAVMALCWPTSLARSYVFHVRHRGVELAGN